MATMTRDEPRRLRPTDRIGGALTFVTASQGRAVAFLLLVSLVAFLPGFFQVPPVDRDETRFAQATKQMVESGDFVDIRFQDEVRYKKPVGIYWLQAVRGACRRGARRSQRAHQDLALSGSIADRRGRRRAHDLLGGARVRAAPLRRARRADARRLDPAQCRGAPRQDRRHAAARQRGRDGRAGARLSGPGRAGRRIARLRAAGVVLDRRRGRDPDQGSGDLPVRRTGRGRARCIRPVAALAARRSSP